MIGQEVSFVFELLGACLAGLVAAICMTIFEIPFWEKWGTEGVAEWQVNAAIVSVIIRKFTRRRVSRLMSVAMHLLHGAALGILFRLLIGSVAATSPPYTVLIYAIVYSVILSLLYH